MSTDKPIFDLDKVPRRWAKQWARTLSESARLGLEVEQNGDEPSKQVAALIALQEVADLQQALIAEVLVAVPASYWHDSAPEDLDCNEPDSLDYMTADGFYKLVAGLQEAINERQQARVEAANDAKN